MSVDLINLKTKCRLCFQRTGSSRKTMVIDEDIQEKFKNFTNLEVISEFNVKFAFVKIISFDSSC